MNFRYQIFIIVAIIYSSHTVLAIESDDCPCDVLEVISDWLVGTQKFTKQIGILNGKPYYFSTKWNLISWKNGTPPYWSLERYNDFSKEFEKIKTFTKKNSKLISHSKQDRKQSKLTLCNGDIYYLIGHYRLTNDHSFDIHYS